MRFTIWSRKKTYRSFFLLKLIKYFFFIFFFIFFYFFTFSFGGLKFIFKRRKICLRKACKYAKSFKSLRLFISLSAFEKLFFLLFYFRGLNFIFKRRKICLRKACKSCNDFWDNIQGTYLGFFLVFKMYFFFLLIYLVKFL